MCGVAGFLFFDGLDGKRCIAERMGRAIAYRGPDDADTWVDEGIALTHRRLAVLDLSSAGRQPMHSASGRWVLAYNGEIYNHVALRGQLEARGEAPAWRGHSDTETLLACIEVWGVERTLAAAVGMFAIALWDRMEHTLYLARDRMGEKPLYYGWQNDVFLFGSELKALRAHPAFDAAVDRDALALLLRHNYIPAPYSIHQNIQKLSPGALLTIRPCERGGLPRSYWSLRDVAERGTSDPFAGSDSDAIDELARLLGKAVAGQQIADVPLGALLSGGVDSSLIAALMREGASRPIHTFTIGFDDEAFDEAAHASAVASHLGTEHRELRLTANDALALVPQLPAMFDEPFADSSQLPTHLVMKLAKQHVTVALSGDGGDEMFGGYNRYFLGPRLWRGVGWLPRQLRSTMFNAAAVLPPALSVRLGVAQVDDKLRKLSRIFSSSVINGIDDLYVGLVSEWPDPASMVIGGSIPPNLLDSRERWPRLADPVARMMVLDGLTYLPDDVLVKVDRAAMAASLETRAPFLDREVVEFAWRLPISMKLRHGKGKWVLRKLLDRYVPRALIERPKMGFGVPLDQWLRGPLRGWAGDLLAEDRLRRQGYLRHERIVRAWHAHLRGEGSFGYRLWSVLMFQAWIEQQGRTV